MPDKLENLFADLLEQQRDAKGKLPPVGDWDPPLSGDIDIRIARNGTWYHEGAPIEREGLTRLFASILKKEGDAYFLVTPVEKWRIQVDDSPFHIRHLDIHQREGRQALVFTTATGDQVTAGPEHPIRVIVDSDSGEPSPYLRVRDGMDGLIARSVFYELVDIAEKGPSDTKKAIHGVYSLGEFFPLE